MKRFPIYNVYRSFFGYPRSENQRRSLLYVLAIRDVMAIVEKACFQKTLLPFDAYEMQLRKSALTSKFVGNAKELFLSYRPYSLDFIDTKLSIMPRWLQDGPKGGVEILTPYIVSKEAHETIMLTFSRVDNMVKELGVFKGMQQHFDMNIPWRKDCTTVTYWDLSAGKSASVNWNEVEPVPLEQILLALNRMVKHELKSA